MDKPVGVLAGLVGDYGSDSSEDEANAVAPSQTGSEPMWSMCVDPGSGFPYYWEQLTNTVSWEPPPGVILPPPSHLTVAAGMIPLQMSKPSKPAVNQPKKMANNVSKKLPAVGAESSSEEEEERIELITSFHNSGSESDDDDAKKKSILGIYPASSRHKAKKKLVQKPKTIKGGNNSTPKVAGPKLPPSLQSISTEVSKKSEGVAFGPEFPKPLEYGPDLPKQLSQNSSLPAANKTSVSLVKEDLSVAGPKAVHNGDVVAAKKSDIINSEETEKKVDNEEDCNIRVCVESDDLEDLMNEKSKLLKKLGDLVPSEIQYLISSPKQSVVGATLSGSNTPKRVKSPKTPPGSPLPPPKTTAALDMDVDDLIAQIEKEQPIDQPVVTSDASETVGSIDSTSNRSPTFTDDNSQPKSDLPFKPLFPCVNNTDKTLVDAGTSTIAVEPIQIDVGDSAKPATDNISEKQPEMKVVNKYETDFSTLDSENANFKRKRRIALDVLPVKKPEPVQNVSYTTKYGETFDTASGRMGLGFKNNLNIEFEEKSSGNSYSNFKKGGIMFQKGESLNPTKENEEEDNKEVPSVDVKVLEDKRNLIEAKLKFLTQSFPTVPPLQQMFIEMQVMWNAWTSGNVLNYLENWISTAGEELQKLEAGAAPPNWTCTFSSESGCYVYQHKVSGERTTQYPLQATNESTVGHSTATTAIAAPEDMDICTTPPPAFTGVSAIQHPVVIEPIVFGPSLGPMEPLPPGTVSPPPTAPPLPCSPPPPPPTPPAPPPMSLTPPPPSMSPEAPPAPNISHRDMMMASNQAFNSAKQPKTEMDPLHAALDSFYSDLANLDSSEPTPAQDIPIQQPLPAVNPLNQFKIQPPIPPGSQSTGMNSPSVSDAATDDQTEKKKKKKTKVSSSYHHRGVNNLVAKWKKVQESLD